MTKQEMFDNAYWGLKVQGKPSIDFFSCLLKDSEGNKCALGFSIPDSEYDANLECRSLYTLNKNIFHLPKSELTMKFLRDLRYAHDAAVYSNSYGDFWDKCEERLFKVAQKYNLEFPGYQR